MLEAEPIRKIHRHFQPSVNEGGALISKHASIDSHRSHFIPFSLDEYLQEASSINPVSFASSRSTSANRRRHPAITWGREPWCISARPCLVQVVPFNRDSDLPNPILPSSGTQFLYWKPLIYKATDRKCAREVWSGNVIHHAMIPI